MPRYFKTAVTVTLGVLLFFGGFVLGVVYQEPAGDQNFQAVAQVWDTILQDYVDQSKVDPQQLSQAAIEAMLNELGDPYSGYLDPEAYQLERDDSQGHFEGIGADVGVKDGLVTIIAPYPDSPAAQAGIEAGDVILAVDGQSVEGLSLLEVVMKVRGPGGSEVTLLIRRTAQTESIEIVVTRGVIDIPSVAMAMRGDVALVRIHQFGDRTNGELGNVLEQVAASGARGIVLDLRDNPGGGLQTVIDVASRFMRDGLVLTVRYNDGQTEEYRANVQSPTTDLPLVVLVNGNSASASEVLAGALQDHGRALIAGQTTFGKGSVNYLMALADGSALYITAARWLTPNGNLIEGEGITPDQILEPSTDWISWAVTYLQGQG